MFCSYEYIAGTLLGLIDLPYKHVKVFCLFIYNEGNLINGIYLFFCNNILNVPYF